eukprot:2277785-Rhodomonas_salina.1
MVVPSSKMWASFSISVVVGSAMVVVRCSAKERERLRSVSGAGFTVCAATALRIAPILVIRVRSSASESTGQPALPASWFSSATRALRMGMKPAFVSSVVSEGSSAPVSAVVSIARRLVL